MIIGINGNKIISKKSLKSNAFTIIREITMQIIALNF